MMLNSKVGLRQLDRALSVFAKPGKRASAFRLAFRPFVRRKAFRCRQIAKALAVTPQAVQDCKSQKRMKQFR